MAARQHNLVTRRQLLGLGLSPRAIAARVAAGKLYTVHAGVYAVGAPPQNAIALAAAAVLACGDGAVLSHDSAAALWGLRRWPQRPEVTAPREKRRPGIRAHRSHTMTARDIRRHQRIRTTSPGRTIADISPRLSDRQLARGVNDARLAKILNAGELDGLLRRCPRLVALIRPDQPPTRSTMEDVFVAFIAAHDLPRPELNARFNGHEVDAIYVDQRVIVELDGRGFHSDHGTFESDRERDADAAERGYLTLRITWERLIGDPTREATRLRRILGACR